MDPLTLAAAARALGADPLPLEEKGFLATGASIDTRTLRAGDLFFALEGENADGHRFLARAREAGAAGAVIRRGAAVEAPRDLPLLRVDDPKRALRDLAAFVRDGLEATVVAVTGSNGKTTTKEMIGAVLAAAGPTVRSERSFNNDLGVPLSILRAGREDAFLVLEIGTSHPGEIARLASLARPHLSVVTNIGEAHLGHFGSLRAVAAEKAALIEALPDDGTAVIHGNDAFAPFLAGRAPGRICTFGRLDAPGAGEIDLDVWGTRVRRTARPRGVAFHLYGKMKVALGLEGLHNADNALAAVAVGLLLGVEPLAIRDALRGVRPVRLRLQRERVNGVTILDDSYNANPASVAAAVDELAATVTDGRRILVFGDMGELGDMAGEQHRRVGRRAAASVDLLWTVGETAALAADAAREAGLAEDRIVRSPSVEIALEGPAFVPSPGDVVLFKASRSVELDRLAAGIRAHLAEAARAREAV